MSKAAELAALIGSQTAQSNRNLIINGAMQVAQRGTSTASISSGNTFVLDRTRFQVSNGGTWTMSQSTTVPSGQGFSNSLKLDCTAADTSLGAADYLMVQQLIEGQNAQRLAFGTSDAKSVVVSFWIRSNKTGTYSFELQHQNSSNAFYHTSKTFTISSANTWEKKEISFAGNTAQNIINSNAVGLYATIWLGSGSNFNGGTFSNGTFSQTQNGRVSSSNVNLADSTSNELYLTAFQLEVGDVATAFEHRSFGDELARCQRYYYESGGTATNDWGQKGYQSANNYSANTLQHPVAMRAAPIGTKVGSFVLSNCNAPSIIGTSTIAYQWQMQKNSTTGPWSMYSNSSGKFTFNAEL